MAWFSNDINVLRRWAAISEEPLPEHFAQYADKFVSQSMQIRIADPELVSILDGSCTAGLKADVLEGKFDPVSPTAEQRADEAQKAELQALFDARPYETGNLTQQLRMAQLSPELATQQRDAAAPDPGRPDLTEAQRQSAIAEQKRLRRSSLEKGLAQSAAVYHRARIRREMLEMHMNDINRAGQGDD